MKDFERITRLEGEILRMQLLLNRIVIILDDITKVLQILHVEEKKK